MQNVWANVKSFNSRGGFSNGLDPTIVGKVLYVNGNSGNDGNSGLSPTLPFLTMAKAFSILAHHDIIVFTGVIREQLTAPQGVFDVTIIGGANRPRQATDSGVATGGGSSWLAPSSPTATTPLLKLREQGWMLMNFQMAPVAASACVRLARAETAALKDASHAAFYNMYFVGGGLTGIGIEDVGGCGFVVVEGCRFQSIADTAIKGISTGIAVPQGWRIENNKFQSNLNDIKMSLNTSEILSNRFLTVGSGATNKVISTTAVSAQGGNNHVLRNFFNNAEAEIAPGNGFTGAATDLWLNYVRDQAALAIGQPA